MRRLLGSLCPISRSARGMACSWNGRTSHSRSPPRPAVALEISLQDGVEATRRIRQIELKKLEDAMQAQIQLERDVWDGAGPGKWN